MRALAHHGTRDAFLRVSREKNVVTGTFAPTRWRFLYSFTFCAQARGASLVDRHKVDGSKAKKAAAAKDGGKKTFSWSREEDFEQRRRFTPQVWDSRRLAHKQQQCLLFSKFVISICRSASRFADRVSIESGVLLDYVM